MFRLLICFYLLSPALAQHFPSGLDDILNNLVELSVINTHHGRSFRALSDSFYQPRILDARSCHPNSRYRSIDGACNNLFSPNYGKTFRKLRRLLPPRYDDGIGRPRLYRGRQIPLPSARKVSTSCLLPDNPRLKDSTLTLMVMQFGQFLDHDITATPELHMPKDCCSSLYGTVHNHYYSGGPCFPITIPRNDRHFRNRCMEFKRSMPANDSIGPREQLNVVTSYIDGSQVYGSSQEEMDRLRLHRRGLLRTSLFNLLPTTSSDRRPCVENDTNFCFDAGDVRANEFPGLTSLHTLFHRQHNRIAATLQVLNPHWNDETIFQESRRIVGAILQHITFDHHLPIILGEAGMRRHGLNKQYRYDPQLHPEIFNSFATAGYRFGHSLITRTYRTYSSRDQRIDRMFFRPHYLTGNFGHGVDEILQGMASRPCQRADKFFTTGVTDHLFEGATANGETFDLVARNIQRGRDHGLPSYSEYRRLATDNDGYQWSGWNSQWGNGLTFLNDRYKRSAGRTKRYAFFSWLWDAWFNAHHNHSQATFSGQAQLSGRCLQAYGYNFNDVDLYVGGMSEPPVEGALLGQTFSYILGKQFFHIKNGDRFWYETKDEKLAFTPAQLRAIKKVTLSRVLCDNTNIGSVQPDIFSQPSYRNPVVSCSNPKIPIIDLTAWQEIPLH